MDAYLAGVGAYTAGTGAPTPPIPASAQAGDILVMVIETSNQAVANDAALVSAGWAHISPSPQGITGTMLTAYWKRHNGAESNPAIGDSGNHTGASILAFRDCKASGNPINASAGDTASSSTSVTVPGLTTTVDGCLVVSVVAWGTDTATGQASGWANSDLVGLTEVLDAGSTAGNGGGVSVAVGTRRSAGSVGATTATLASASAQGRISFALIPELDHDVTFVEEFTGSNGAAWPGAWTTSGSSSTQTIQGNTGQLAWSDTANATSRAILSGPDAVADCEVLLSFKWNATSALAYLSFYLRGSGGWQNAYRPNTCFGVQLASNSTLVTGYKNVSGTPTSLGNVSGVHAVTTTKQWLRMRVQGNVLSLKVWTDGDAEPGAWEAEWTDGDVSAAGALHMSLVRAGSNSGAKNVEIDDVQVTRFIPTVPGSALPPRLAESTGTVYYVDNTTGNDSRSEGQAQNEATPWATIQKAINTITAQNHTGGPKVMVKATGTPYSEHLQDARPSGRQGTAAHMLTFEGYGGRPQVSPSSPSQNYLCHVYRSGSYYGGFIRFKYFEFGPFVRDNAGGITGFYLDGSPTHVELDDVVIRDLAPATSVGRVSAIYTTAGANNIRLWGVRVHGVDASAVGQAGLSHCAYIGGTDISAVNCVFTGAGNGFGTQLYGATSSARILFAHCTWAGNAKSGILIHHRYTDITVRNCISAGNGEYGIVGYQEGSPAGPRQSADWLVLHGNTGGAVSIAANSLLVVTHISTSDPDFTDPGGRDYSIGEDSAAIGHSAESYVPATDITGAARG